MQRPPPRGPRRAHGKPLTLGKVTPSVSSEGSAGEQVHTLALFLSLAPRHAQGCPATVLHTNLLKGTKSQAYGSEVGAGAWWRARCVYSGASAKVQMGADEGLAAWGQQARKPRCGAYNPLGIKTALT